MPHLQNSRRAPDYVGSCVDCIPVVVSGIPCVPISFQCPFAALTTDLSNDRKSSRESLRVVPVTAVRRLRCKRAGALPEPRAASATGAAKGAHSGPTARVQRQRISMASETVQKFSLKPTAHQK